MGAADVEAVRRIGSAQMVAALTRSTAPPAPNPPPSAGTVHHRQLPLATRQNATLRGAEPAVYRWYSQDRADRSSHDPISMPAS